MAEGKLVKQQGRTACHGRKAVSSGGGVCEEAGSGTAGHLKGICYVPFLRAWHQWPRE